MSKGSPADICSACDRWTVDWQDYFCPGCGTHNDALYCRESRSRKRLDREAIVAEYRACGQARVADRLMEAPQPQPWIPQRQPLPKPGEVVERRQDIHLLVSQLGGQTKAARMLGCSSSMLSRIVSGRRNATPVLRERLTALVNERQAA